MSLTYPTISIKKHPGVRASDTDETLSLFQEKTHAVAKLLFAKHSSTDPSKWKPDESGLPLFGAAPPCYPSPLQNPNENRPGCPTATTDVDANGYFQSGAGLESRPAPFPAAVAEKLNTFQSIHDFVLYHIEAKKRILDPRSDLCDF